MTLNKTYGVKSCSCTLITNSITTKSDFFTSFVFLKNFIYHTTK